MDNGSGWIKIHRKILSWEWYIDTNMVRLFLHLLLCANYEDKRWRGQEIKRGQLVTSVSVLSQQTNLTEMQIRTCLTKLSNSGEINKQTTNRNTIITICNYDSYQQTDTNNNEQNNKQTTSQSSIKQQTNNKQITTTKEYKEDKEYKENEEDKNIDTLTCVTHESETQYGAFHDWLRKECTYIAKHYKLPTDAELEKLVDQFGADMVAEMCQQLENRADLRKKYTNLYRTMLNWCKREKQHDERQFNSDSQQRLNTYAAVAAGFRRDAEVRRSADVHGDI